MRFILFATISVLILYAMTGTHRGVQPEDRLTEQMVIDHHKKRKAEHDALPAIREGKIKPQHKKGIRFENAVQDAVNQQSDS